MENKPAHHDLEWVVVSKRLIYTIITLLALTLVTFGAGSYLWLSGHSLNSTHEENGVAGGGRFDMVDGEVRVVRAATRETIVVDTGTRLAPGDIVQTLASGRAGMTLADGSTLLIRPNSVITIAESTGAVAGSNSHVRVAVERGGVKVSTDRQTSETSNIVETLLTKNKLATKTVASFDVQEDDSEEIRVSTGVVEAQTRGGQTTLHSGEYIAFSQSGDIKRYERLLDTPMAFAPFNFERIEARRGDHATVSLQWTHLMTATAHFYQVQIASSPFFIKAGIIFERERLITTKLTVTELKAGNYYWRVRAISTAGQASEWCEPQKFAVLWREDMSNAKRIQ